MASTEERVAKLESEVEALTRFAVRAVRHLAALGVGTAVRMLDPGDRESHAVLLTATDAHVNKVSAQWAMYLLQDISASISLGPALRRELDRLVRQADGEEPIEPSPLVRP